MARSLVVRLYAAVVAVLVSASATQAQTAQDYGDIGTFSEKEAADASKYGGLPNTKLFNNGTPCRSIVSLFDKPGMNKDAPDMAAFLRFSRHSLMGLDMVSAMMFGVVPAITVVGTKTWGVLPALIPAYCRTHPREKVEDALMAVYRTVRLTTGLVPTK